MMLDATCGFRYMWRNKDTSNVLFLDKRKEVKPDIVADARFLPFRDKSFTKIFCDPPHMIRNDQDSIIKNQPDSVGASYLQKFSNFKERSEWISFLFYINNEFKRCLIDNGTLWFKLTDGKDRRITKLKDVETFLTNFKIFKKTVGDVVAPWSNNKRIFLDLNLADYMEQIRRRDKDGDMLELWNKQQPQ